MDLPPRVVSLVLVDAGGRPLGVLPPFEAETPWWMDIGPVVHAVRSRHGLRVTVLRLLEAERAQAHGGAVTYLAQLDEGDTGDLLKPWHRPLPDHPLRHPYARVGGPHADLAWAKTELQRRGDGVIGEPQQIRSWNLSSLWRLRTAAASVWLKVLPPFFAYEGALIAALQGEAVPRLLAHDGARMLMAELPGNDLYDATLDERRVMIDVLVALQQRWAGRADELLSLGLPDARAPALCTAIAALIERRADAVEPADRPLLAAFVAGLPARCAQIHACGLPEALVHGDFHSGNARGGSGHGLALLDWGDSAVGHPLLDLPGLVDRSPADQAQPLQGHWFEAWRRALPGCDPQRASHLLAPIAAVRGALVYQRFLDQIEPAEHPYHRADVPRCLHQAADVLRRASA